MTPTASLIIPTYNRAELLGYTLESVLKQDVPKSTVEVIVVDDGSSDDTFKVAQEYSNALNMHYIYQPDKGYRVATARNLGIRLAKGEILIFVDSGLILANQFLSSHLAVHQASAAPLAVIGYVYCFDHTEALQCDKIDPYKPQKTIDYFKSQQTQLDIREECYCKCNDRLALLPAPWVLFWGGNISVRKDVVLAVGGFDENFDYTWGTEDVEFGYRLHQRQIEFVLNREAEAIHYPHERYLDERFLKELKNKIYFHEKHNSMETKIFIESTGLTLNEDILKYKSACAR